jgi:predicted RNase H-like HicB family nuclease
LTTYIALLRKDPDSDFGVDFPDFRGCITAGSTLEEARAMAREALAGHIACMAELGQPIPEPSSLEAVMADADNAEAIPFLVAVPDQPTRTVRINVTMPETDLKVIDAVARKQGKSRSALLTEAVRRLIAAEREHHAA